MLGSGELVTGVRSTFGAAPPAVTPQSVTHAKSKQKPRIVDPSPRQSWYNRDGRSSWPNAGLIAGMRYLILSCPAKRSIQSTQSAAITGSSACADDDSPSPYSHSIVPGGFEVTS